MTPSLFRLIDILSGKIKLRGKDTPDFAAGAFDEAAVLSNLEVPHQRRGHLESQQNHHNLANKWLH